MMGEDDKILMRKKHNHIVNLYPDILGDLEILGFECLDHQEKKDYHTVEIKVAQRPSECKYCLSKNLNSYGKARKREIRDVPYGNKEVYLLITPQRYKCKACGKTFCETLPGIDDKHNATKRLVDHVGRQVLFNHMKYSEIANEMGLASKVVQNIVKERTKFSKNTHLLAASCIMLYIVHVLNKDLYLLIDLQNNRVRKVFERNRNAPNNIAGYLKKLNDRENINYVIIDMSAQLKSAVNRVLPKVKIVIDKYSVLKEIDIELKKLSRDAAAMNTTVIRESISNIYQAKSKDEALKKYDKLKNKVFEVDCGERTDHVPTRNFGTLFPFVKEWEKEILAFFELPLPIPDMGPYDELARKIADRNLPAIESRFRYMHGRPVRIWRKKLR